jgi:hypothetical protein
MLSGGGRMKLIYTLAGNERLPSHKTQGSQDSGSKALSPYCPCYSAVHHCQPTVLVLWDSLLSSTLLSPAVQMHH